MDPNKMDSNPLTMDQKNFLKIDPTRTLFKLRLSILSPKCSRGAKKWARAW